MAAFGGFDTLGPALAAEVLEGAQTSYVRAEDGVRYFAFFRRLAHRELEAMDFEGSSDANDVHQQVLDLIPIGNPLVVGDFVTVDGERYEITKVHDILVNGTAIYKKCILYLAEPLA